MENYGYSSSYPDSGDSSSPHSREVDCDGNSAGAVNSWDEPPPPTAAARIKLMCSYGGRIQPRSHDSQLSYVGGDTKILAVDRSISYHAIIAKLAALSGSDDVILKYQLPGEDLDALISVTNDEDLDHMMIEYDRLHRTGSKPVPRLRLFLFGATGKGSQDRVCFADQPPSVMAASPKEGPDYLFGLDAASFIPQEAELKDPAVEKLGIEVPPARPEAEVVVSPTEMQMHVQELQRLRIAEQQQEQQASTVRRNGSEETLDRVYPPADYYAPPPVQGKAPPAPAPQPAYWQDNHRNMAPAAGFASFVGGDGNVYLIPANSGVFPGGAPPGQAYYTAVQRVVPATAYDSTAAMYAAPQQQVKAQAAYDNGVRAQAAYENGVRAQAAYDNSVRAQTAYDNSVRAQAAYESSVRAQAVEVGGGYAAPTTAGAYDNGAGFAGAAYDSAGRPVYYAAGAGPTYQTVSNLAGPAESKVVKPPQVS